ncbi:hypothetical protein [Mycolicibacterium conceptionense]|uniref:hypothetical protein n=1 Tax=Mycolicibacterium conceptionense TaxID=451644 RepID=UPI00096F6F30|nr:hypothetical protein [Mycolicibacterium conceptionense]OMB79277.1 hypothetical protein A5743_14335 [Mycolicibacterium conceptionense]
MFWPGRGEALSRTIEAESALSDLYSEALRRWAPAARAVALPALTAAALPPDPAALAQAQSAWDQHADEVVLAGIGILWAVAVFEAAKDLGVAPVAAATPELSTVVLGIVLASVLLSRRDVEQAVGYVESVPALMASRADYLESLRPDVAGTPGLVRAKVESALADMTMEVERTTLAPESASDAPGRSGVPAPAEPRITIDVVPETRPEVLAAKAAEVLEVDSPAMQAVARDGGYQAAEVLNHAVLAAALQSEDADELHKVWISTLDGKTRPSHWAADGQRAPLAGTFTVGGEQMRFPADPTASAAERKNCRCRLGILGADEEIPDEMDRHTERLNGRDSVVINRDGRTQAEEIERRRNSGNIRARDDENGIGRIASGGWAAPSEQEYEMATEDAETYLTFTDALFAVTGTPTSDRRMLAADIDLTFRDTPLPLQWCEKSKGGHDDSVTIGVIESLSYSDGEVRASGYLLNNEHAAKAFDLMSHGVANPSVDLGGEFEMFETYDDGTVVTDENFDPSRPIYRTITRAEVLATTIVAIPAFGQTRISLNAERESRDRALVASAAAKFQPRVYDPALFSDPGLTGPTPLSIDPATGRIFGHIAVFNEKHRSVGLGHISPPRSRTGYAHFHTSPPVHLADGTRLAVGRLTVGIGHAPTSGVTNAEAQAHYDNVEACFALVRAGEDSTGVWVSGVAAPWATPEKVEMGLSAPLSGDWRPYGGDLELVAALAVNTPGFVCRSTTDAQGNPLSLVASLSPRPGTEASPMLSLTDIKAVVAEALAESQRAAELAQRRATVLARAKNAVGDPPPELTPTERMGQLLELHSDPGAAFADPNPGRGMPAQFKKYWLSGAGAAKIRWGTPGDFNRCVTAINAKIVENGRKPLPDHEIKGLCAKLHKEATGARPGQAPGEKGA